jgi:hypothetical protein
MSSSRDGGGGGGYVPLLRLSNSFWPLMNERLGLITRPIEHRPPLEANSRAASLDIPVLLNGSLPCSQQLSTDKLLIYLLLLSLCVPVILCLS